MRLMFSSSSGFYFNDVIYLESMESKINIEKLDPADKESILKIANWYYEEWDTPIDKIANRLSNQPGKDIIFQLVLTKGDEVVATGGLYNDVNIYRDYEKLKKFKPWVSALYTHQDYRNQGFGTMLLKRIELGARERDLDKIYLYTFTAESLYRRHGWRAFTRVMYKGHDTAVMKKNLQK